MRLFLLSNSPMNAPMIMQRITLGIIKNGSTNMLSINPALVATSTMAAHAPKPITEAPMKRNVALLDTGKLEGVILTYPIRPIRRVIVSSKTAVLAMPRFIM